VEGTNPVRVGVGLTNLLGWGAEAGCCTSLDNLRQQYVRTGLCMFMAKCFGVHFVMTGCSRS